MSKATINNGDAGSVARAAINDNFTELYGAGAGSGRVIQWESGPIVISARGADAAAANGVMDFQIQYDMTVTAVYATCNVAPTGSAAQIDINEAGVSILSTKLTIDAGETSSRTAATPPVISDAALAADSIISFDLDQVGSSVPGQNYIVYLIGTRTL